VLEDAIDGVDSSLDAGALEGVERRPDAQVDLRRGIAATGERKNGIGRLLVGPLGAVLQPATRPEVGLVPGVVDSGAISTREVAREHGPHAPAGQRIEDVVDGAEIRGLQTRPDRHILAAVRLGDLGRVPEQRLQRGGLVRVGLEELRDGRRRAFLVHDQPQLRPSRVGVVGEAAQRRVGERVRAQDDQLADALGAQVHVDEPPQWLAVRKPS
jgi:hypothetical protein